MLLSSLKSTKNRIRDDIFSSLSQIPDFDISKGKLKKLAKACANYLPEDRMKSYAEHYNRCTTALALSECLLELSNKQIKFNVDIIINTLQLLLTSANHIVRNESPSNQEWIDFNEAVHNYHKAEFCQRYVESKIGNSKRRSLNYLWLHIIAHELDLNNQLNRSKLMEIAFSSLLSFDESDKISEIANINKDGAELRIGFAASLMHVRKADAILNTKIVNNLRKIGMDVDDIESCVLFDNRNGDSFKIRYL